MGSLVVQQFVSVDGFAANERNEFTLFDQVDGDSDDFDRNNLAWLESVGAIVLGANTYRMFAGYWPTSASQGELVAARINSLPKVVFSRTLTSAPWGEHPDATVEAGDVRPAIRRLIDKTDGDIIVWGSLTLTEALFDAGLVDIVRLVVVPVAIGRGRGAFPTYCGTQKLRLQHSTRFENGSIELEYAVEDGQQ